MGVEGIMPLAAGCAARLVPRLPASARANLWWLACLKLVFDLFWAAPLALPLLPAPAARLAPAFLPAAATLKPYSPPASALQ